MSKALTFLFLALLTLASGSSLYAGPVQTADNTCQAIRESAAHNAAPATAALLCALIEERRLEELSWPDCSPHAAQVEQFYLLTGYAFAWTREGAPTQQANSLIELFRAAEKKGLEPEDYDASRWAMRVQALTASGWRPEELARFDFALTLSSLRYLSDLHHGRVSPAECQVNLPQKPFEGPQFLRHEIVAATDVSAAVQTLDPPYEGYRRTVAALERYIDLAQHGEGPPLPPIKTLLRPGDSSGGLRELAERLRQLGDLPANASMPASDTYQEPLIAAVKAFQRRHGLQVDGIVGCATLEQISVPVSRRIAQIKLALERWRWLPRSLGPRVLVVNIPEFRLRAYDDHRMTLTMRAIVGQALVHQTPVFSDAMESIIFRPYWNVPESIQKEELVPLLRRNPGYLARQKMEVVNAKEEIVATSVNAKILKQLATGSLHIRQQPGPANTLGLIKFVFPNQFDVYLHGTPERGLFYQPRRDFSHGCIRIEDPAALARWVLRDRPEWTEKLILATMSGETPLEVPLAAPIPVLILYGTAFVEENSEIRFFQDIYGQDATLEKALAARRR